LIFLSWTDRLRSLEKIAERFSLSLSFPFLSFLCRSGRCQDAPLPRAITQWPPLFLRGYHAPIAESSDPREIMDCHDALSIASPRTSAYNRLCPCRPEISSRNDPLDKPLLARPALRARQTHMRGAFGSCASFRSVTSD